jgi:hypothetical protein
MTNFEYPVYRTRPLPERPLVGQFLLSENVFRNTRKALVDSALAGLQERGHEGLVFWAGAQHGPLTVFTTVVIPPTDHRHGGVFVTERGFGAAVRAARAQRLLVLAQVHSHPGDDARHSDGDDELIVMPFAGMLSVVVPQFGVGWHDLESARVHQFHSGKWVLCTETSVRDGITVAPGVVDAR